MRWSRPIVHGVRFSLLPISLCSPLVLTGWMRVKEAAAAGALFVFLNSAAGLTGQFSKGIHVDEMVLPLALAALIGGQIGSRAGSYHMPALGVRRVLAALVVVVAARLVWEAV